MNEGAVAALFWRLYDETCICQ